MNTPESTPTCRQCGSTERIIPHARISGNPQQTVDLSIVVDTHPEALLFKETIRAPVVAKVCCDCGYVELYVVNQQYAAQTQEYVSWTQDLWAAYMASQKDAT
jgi:predicted nucleic-acid-binding Zn-ribbon protein